ncbi:MAG: hypothetical protein GY832_30595 [Chloroflexi bacterium]|nr:hypothetical protein [Chloroflexota bacterium]
MDEAKLKALLEEAIAHCYDEEDEFWGVFSALVGRISFPLQATMQGESITLVGMDGHTSAPEAGIMVHIQEGDQEKSVALIDIEAIDPDAAGAEWLEVHRFWSSNK